MSSVNVLQLESNSKIKINFNGGDLSSDSGLLLIKEFAHKFGFHQHVSQFKTDDMANRFHKDDKNLLQLVYQIIAGYFEEDDADELTNEPVFANILDKKALASQPTLSRFWNRMNEKTLSQFNEITKSMRASAYAIKCPKQVLLDLDSTLLKTFGKQEGEGFNYHYRAHGYHPLLCYDGLTGDLLKAQLRGGTDYSSTGVVHFMQPLLDEYDKSYPDVELFLRGDSGFATPDLFKQCETNGVSYAIRLKANSVLYSNAKHLDEEILEATKDNMIDAVVCYDEFYYRAGTWDYPRRVVVKVEKPYNQLTYQYSFIVTNMDLSPEEILMYYRNRGTMENFIKEGKSGFDFASTSSKNKVTNANRLGLHVLAYNLFNYFRRLVLPKNMKKMQIDTIRLKLLKVASKIVKAARYIYFKLCSSCPYKEAFYETLENIRRLPQLE
ncbi:IS1380 family transposase [Fusibacter paucivorans]|uniref:IS1380 family transposase n=1 Tax=Fusibacter paucivorans TaxID=76009 RepID=A0ABS5PW61_9FIRM|nr:IS1380 family transposase [Fusibacter paucivorans]MBS7528861.1 IS1380 family transposase [Fusibacter paucivorans]